MTAKEKISGFVLNQAMNYISGDPEKNLPKLLAWVDGIGWGEGFATHKKVLHDVLENPENNWYQYVMGLWKDIDNDVLKTTFRNFWLNASLFGGPKLDANAEKYGCNIPWAILLDPTSACNLKCTGCWAAEYGNSLNMSYETLDGIIRQGKELGTYFY